MLLEHVSLAFNPRSALYKRKSLFDISRASDALRRLAGKLGCDFEEVENRAYAWRERRSETEYPTREELFSIAPATVQSKTHYGLEWFESRWTGMQMKLFQALSR